ncbi:MAG: adenylate kinase [Acidobacteriaceae bacterium]
MVEPTAVAEGYQIESQVESEADWKAVTPGPMLLMGAPGVGKGTQAKGIMAVWGIPQISTGDLLRDHRQRGTSLGAQATGLMDSGKLVSDDLVNQMVAERLQQPDTVRGYILDGYPRTLAQAEWLDQRLAAAPGALPLIAVSIQVSYNQLLRRITGRRNCPTCQLIYNVYLQPPKFDTVCDKDGTPLIQRADDVETVFHERMRTYAALTAPVVEHYRAGSRFVEVDGEQSADKVMTDILAGVARLRSQSLRES